MVLCPECGNIAYRNSYFGVVYCHSCGWRSPLERLDMRESRGRFSLARKRRKETHSSAQGKRRFIEEPAGTHA
jgi:uncharacterized Zn finger protein (UPF0148 family)